MTKWVYGFGGGSADGDASMKNLLGGKDFSAMVQMLRGRLDTLAN